MSVPFFSFFLRAARRAKRFCACERTHGSGQKVARVGGRGRRLSLCWSLPSRPCLGRQQRRLRPDCSSDSDARGGTGKYGHAGSSASACVDDAAASDDTNGGARASADADSYAATRTDARDRCGGFGRRSSGCGRRGNRVRRSGFAEVQRDLLLLFFGQLRRSAYTLVGLDARLGRSPRRERVQAAKPGRSSHTETTAGSGR
jgi:hypothetical protein